MLNILTIYKFRKDLNHRKKKPSKAMKKNRKEIAAIFHLNCSRNNS